MGEVHSCLEVYMVLKFRANGLMLQRVFENVDVETGCDGMFCSQTDGSVPAKSFPITTHQCKHTPLLIKHFRYSFCVKLPIESLCLPLKSNVFDI